MNTTKTAKRLGALGFAFFAIKGCLWLGLAAAASMGLVNLPG